MRNNYTFYFIFISYLFMSLICFGQEYQWPDPVACDVIPYYASGLTHGPMLGRLTSNSIRVWIRTNEPTEFRVAYGEKLQLTENSAGVTGRTLKEKDNTGFVDLYGLKSNTRYYYGVVIDGRMADTRMDFDDEFPSFRTVPSGSEYQNPELNTNGLYNFSFSVACGGNQHPFKGGGHYTNSPAFGKLFERHGKDLLFHIMNGDFIYEENRIPSTDHKIDQFRADYKLYLSRGRNMSRMYRYVPSFFTYDDHESYSDLEGTGEIGLKDGKWLYRDLSLGPWYEYAGWANFDGPHQAEIYRSTCEVKKGNDVLYDTKADFSTLDPNKVSTILVDRKQTNAGVYELVAIIDKNRLRVRPEFSANEKCTYSIGTFHYFDRKIGNCHFFILDTRGQRTRYIPEKAHDPDRFVLGQKQSSWLMEGVRKTDADFIFIVSSVAWTIYHTNFHVARVPPSGRSPKEDGFAGYVVEREKLLNHLDQINKPIILLTGDLHNSLAVQISDNVWEFVCAPINSSAHPRATAGYPKYGGWFDSEGRWVKIKWMGGFPDDVHFSRLNNVFYTVINVNNVFKSTFPEGTGLRWVAYDSPQVIVQFYDGYTGKLLYAEGISKVDLQAEPKTKM